MSSFEDGSQIRPPEPLAGSPPLTAGAASSMGPLSAADREQLRQRASEARMRTMELIARYVGLSARGTATLERARDSISRTHEERAALSASVARYAVLLRSLGEPPERTLILIKTAFSEAAPQQDPENREILESVVRWFVEAYYAA
jgi:hypothetical protein